VVPSGYLGATTRPFNAALRIFEMTYVASDTTPQEREAKGSHATRRRGLPNSLPCLVVVMLGEQLFKRCTKP